MGIEAAAAFLPDLFAGGAAAAADVAPEAIAGAADIAPFASGADVLAAGGADVLGLGGLGDTAALGAGAAAADIGAAGAGAADVGAGLGAAGAGAGLGSDIAAGAAPAVAPAVSDVAALGGGASFLPDLAGVDLGLGGGGAVPSLGTAAGGADTTALASLASPNIPPVGIGGGPAAPTIGATQVGDLTSQNLQTWLGGAEASLGQSDVGLGGSAATNVGGGLPNLPADTGSSLTQVTGDAGPTSVTPLSVTDYTQTPTPPIDQSIPTTNPDVAPPAPQAGATTYTAPAATTPASTNAAAAGGGAAAKGGGGGFDWWKAAGLGLAAAPLAITLARGEPSLPGQSQQAQGIDTGVGAAGQQLLQSAVSNTPMPGQQAYLTANRQQMINQMRQQLYNSGVQNPEADARWPSMVAQVDNAIAQEQQGFIDSNLKAALQATGQASQGLTNIAQQQVALDTAYQQAIAGASGSLGRLVGQTGTRLL